MTFSWPSPSLLLIKLIHKSFMERICLFKMARYIDLYFAFC